MPSKHSWKLIIVFFSFGFSFFFNIWERNATWNKFCDSCPTLKQAGCNKQLLKSLHWFTSDWFYSGTNSSSNVLECSRWPKTLLLLWDLLQALKGGLLWPKCLAKAELVHVSCSQRTRNLPERQTITLPGYLSQDPHSRISNHHDVSCTMK